MTIKSIDTLGEVTRDELSRAFLLWEQEADGHPDWRPYWEDKSPEERATADVEHFCECLDKVRSDAEG